MNRKKLANTQRGKSSQRLEGSRFAILQLCNLAASGSRERLVIVQLCPSGMYPSPPEQRRLVKHHPETFAGAACCRAIELPRYKAASLQVVGDAMSRSIRGRETKG